MTQPFDPRYVTPAQQGQLFAMPEPKRRRGWLWAALALFVVSLVALSVAASLSSPTRPGDGPGAGIARLVGDVEITRAEFDGLVDGMTYAEVSEAIGSPGELVADMSLGTGGRIVTYSYNGGTMASATLTFTDDRLTQRFQMGLQ